MAFTDIFIRRPVLACVVSAMIFLVGLRSIDELQVRQYPEISSTVIEVITAYPGADAQLMQGFVTDPIQAALARVDGVDYITSESVYGRSVVTAYIRLNHDPDAAMTEVMSQVAAVKSDLPEEAEDPVIYKRANSGVSSLYMSFSSDRLTRSQMSDYVSRVVRPRMAVLPGVASVNLLGEQKISLRVWLDPQKLALHNMTPQDVHDVLRKNNLQTAVGSLRGRTDSIAMRAETSVNSAEAIRDLIIKSDDQGVVRLADIAQVTMGAESTNSSVFSNGLQALFVSIDTTPDANPLTVVRAVKDIIPEIRARLPQAIRLDVNYDSTMFIREAIYQVLKTLVEALLIVICIIFAFMGSIRSVSIPIVTIPLSLVGVCTVMLAMGASLNLMTLLAFVLAIGLVVDDAIVVVENIHRHIEEGKKPFEAAMIGAREILTPVISMTVTLVAVYAPVAFLGGVTGVLFKEFALTLAGSVLMSGVIALTLSPVMCSRLLSDRTDDDKIAQFLDGVFSRLAERYKAILTVFVTHRRDSVALIGAVLACLPFMFYFSAAELAPKEDKGLAISVISGPADASPEYMSAYVQKVGETFDGFSEKDTYFLIAGSGSIYKGFGGMILKPWGDRDRSQGEIVKDLGDRLDTIPGLDISSFSLPSLPGASGMPVQFVISTTDGYESLKRVTDVFRQAVQDSGYFIVSKFDLQYERPELRIHVDREKANFYQVTMQDIGSALGRMYGGGHVNRVDIDGKAYKVIPQAERAFRLSSRVVNDVHVRNAAGSLIPLSNLVRFEVVSEPNFLAQFNQLNSATLGAVPMPGVSMGDAVGMLEKIARDTLPSGYLTDYAGPIRQFVSEGDALVLTFVFALIFIYLVLAAQYESFRDPLVIMFTVPLAVAGAMSMLCVGAATLNIYTQVGLITLVGLITRHGILICEVARQQQIVYGKDRTQAVIEAASIRLRPILMTTAATIAGAFPLIIASGAGAAARYSIGLVIVSGLLIGTVFTLFVLPVVYTFLAEEHRKASHTDSDGSVSDATY